VAASNDPTGSARETTGETNPKKRLRRSRYYTLLLYYVQCDHRTILHNMYIPMWALRGRRRAEPIDFKRRPLFEKLALSAVHGVRAVRSENVVHESSLLLSAHRKAYNIPTLTIYLYVCFFY